MNSTDVTAIEAALVGAADPEIVALEARIRTAQLDADVGGTLFRGTYRYTRVWARARGGGWRVVAGHVSEIPLPDGAPPGAG